MRRLVAIATFGFLFAIVFGGCAKTVPIPVSIKRDVPRPPAECNEKADAGYPRLTVKPGQVVDPIEGAKYSIQARQWAQQVQARRRVCGVYGRRMQTWR